MQCLKCGRETQDAHVFCDTCLAQMEKHPVKPGTPVTIYNRPKNTVNSTVKKQIKPEELLIKLHKQNHRLIVWLIIMSVLFAISAGILGWKVYQDLKSPPLGQNYNTETPMTLEPAIH